MRTADRTLAGRLHDLVRPREQHPLALRVRPVCTSTLPDLGAVWKYIHPHVYRGDPKRPDGFWTSLSISRRYPRLVGECFLAKSPRLVRMSVNGLSWHVWLQAGSFEDQDAMPEVRLPIFVEEELFPSVYVGALNPEVASTYALSHLAGFDLPTTRKAAFVVRLASQNEAGFAPGLVAALRDGDSLPWLVYADWYADWCAENLPECERYVRAVASSLRETGPGRINNQREGRG